MLVKDFLLFLLRSWEKKYRWKMFFLHGAKTTSNISTEQQKKVNFHLSSPIIMWIYFMLLLLFSSIQSPHLLSKNALVQFHFGRVPKIFSFSRVFLSFCTLLGHIHNKHECVERNESCWITSMWFVVCIFTLVFWGSGAFSLYIEFQVPSH
jgi:hypothetical protein